MSNKIDPEKWREFNRRFVYSLKVHNYRANLYGVIGGIVVTGIVILLVQLTK